MTNLLTIEIRFEQDVVMTRQRSRQIAELLGFDSQDRTRIATAVSEIARNAFQYAKGGKVVFRVEGDSPQSFVVSIRDRGSGITNLQAILEGRYTSKTGMGLGIIGTKRLMDRFDIESSPQGTTVVMGKTLPQRVPVLTAKRLAQITDELVMRSPQNPFEEVQQQNQELLRTLEELQKRQSELAQLNGELEDTNRGVMALYTELDEKAGSLQQANELKTRFFSNMSHEFRTPLNSIMSLARILLDRMDGELTPEQEKQVKFISKAAEGLSDLVNDLLDLAKVEAGKIVVHPNEFEVGDLFGTLRGMLRPLLASNSSISLVFEEPIGVPTLCTDEGKVAQILRNFISNALKFTEDGEIRVTAVMAGKMVVFSVADTGIGIAPEDRERIFEDYIQVNSHIQSRVKGTGLGLPLSRQLAHLLGGSVWVKSETGIGSTFFAAIPVIYECVEIAPVKTEAEVVWKLDIDRSIVLVIEDNEETLFTYEKYFQESIYQFVSARSLTEVKQALQMFEPVAIVSDILLDDKHTWNFISDMKGNPATQNIPIIVITVIDNETKVLSLGSDAFFIKPVERLLLLNTVNMLVNRDRQPKILIVDDDRVSRYLLKELLTDIYNSSIPTIIEATNGREGILLANQENPSCIFLDIAMPEMNGFEVLEQLKGMKPSYPVREACGNDIGNHATSKIPIIINTSDILKQEERQYLAELTVAILPKDSSSREVVKSRIQEALVKAGLFLEAIKKNHV